ncbi:hypothetical protein AURANDRAFT_20037 [Aureococcus anophagefferens]|uniref:Phosphatase PP2A regulatory subunit A/Splicing factor 3B subunit 1-like HEAT repeat domain-containing protein n=1 Tax=Aureococcus anophagefferens TaxID=44056 RepID=F0XZ45_AURAN|nr:hypothetical protein AURANDRAFT_20037 [Aureococcus anophagefferens]EGB11876.1 hypothetical protein AURANDRAFT_20037 [Aureococcus anophagefferens]|eukprot:XP_009032993.1 hypothetical protein AURANDRAFT_20037 [Aureococcus anophagefferens]
MEGAAPPPDDGGGCVDLGEIAVLIDQLKNEDVRLRLESNANLLRIARALGPERVREELVPFICDLTDDSDDVLFEMADQLGSLGAYVGGPAHAHVVLEPLEALAAVEEARVRDRAVRAALEVAAAMPDESLVSYYVPFVQRLGNHDWFTARISACGLFAGPHGRLPGRKRVIQLRFNALFARLCRDDTPMVRRVAAGQLGAIALAGGSSDGEPLGSLVSLFEALARDDQDSVRLQTVGNCAALFRALEPARVRGTVLPVLLATATDRSWRVRWSAAAAFAELAAAVDDDVGGDDGAHCAEALRATFVGLLNDVEPEVRCAAAGALSGVARRVRDEDAALAALAPSIEALSRDGSQQVRAALASSVGDLAPALGRDATVARVLPVLLALLRDANAEVRLNIISNLGPVHAVVGVDLLSQSLLPAIVDLADDAKWRVRGAIIEHVPLIADQLGVAFFDDALKAKCVGWLADDVAAIRIAATRNLRLLAAKFGERWARDVALPKVADLARQRYYLRRITALRALDALCDVLAPEDVAADVLATVLDLCDDLCDDPVANVRFNAAATLRKLAPRLQRHRAGAELALLKTKLRSLADDDGDVDVVAIASEAAAAVDGDE